MSRSTPRSRPRSSPGTWRRGEALPSIRALAKDLRISVITTKRAYDELEAEGFLYTVAGKGCFVAEKNLELVREQQLKSWRTTWPPPRSWPEAAASLGGSAGDAAHSPRRNTDL